MNKYTINDMYKYAKENNIKLLSDYPASWWNEYRTNFRRYDQIFRRKYLSFKYFLQNETNTLAENTAFFSDEVYSHLMTNSKKYEELYRVHVIDDSSYSLTDNYSLTEHMEREEGLEASSTSGSRQDTSNITNGTRTDNTTVNSGARVNTSTDAVAPFDIPAVVNTTASGNGGTGTVATSSGYYGNNQSVSQTNAFVDTNSTTYGGSVDSTTLNKGSQTDSNASTTTEEYTLTRTGNIGTISADDIIQKHIRTWSMWDFYEYIFSDICKEMLEVTD